MKINNFELVEVIGKSPINFRFKAKVDITTGFFIKKTKSVYIHKTYTGSWFFSASGEYIPDTVEDLVRSFEAAQGKPLEQCDCGEYIWGG